MDTILLYPIYSYAIRWYTLIIQERGDYMSYLILKLSNHDIVQALSKIPLEEVLSDGWRITYRKLGNTQSALAVYNGVIVAEFKFGESLHYDHNSKRMRLDLKPVESSQYIRKMINYKTSNRASVVSDTKLAEILITEDDIKGEYNESIHL